MSPNAVQIIGQVRNLGIAVARHGGHIHVDPISRLTPGLRAALSQHKAAILAALEAEKLKAAVFIEAHGETFVVIPDSEAPAKWAGQGIPLTVSEVEALQAGCGGEPMNPEAVRALAVTKRCFGANLEGYRQESEMAS